MHIQINIYTMFSRMVLINEHSDKSNIHTMHKKVYDINT